ncbi:MAG: helix-turn-helix domain-containing protein, partial [Phocaeicola sp.]
ATSLAAKIGIGRSTLSLFLNRKARMSQDNIEAAFKVLGITLNIENYEKVD